MNGRRIKLILILGVLALSGLVLIAWTQEWFALELDSGQLLPVAGDVAAGGLAALALAGLALGAALTIAGPVFRVILGLLQVAIGALVVTSAAIALADPVRASAQSITTVTGVSGDSSVRELVVSSAISLWPAVTAALGVLLAVAGIAVIATLRRWPASSRKYQAVRLENEAGGASGVGDWDALSEGRDPT